MKRTVFILTALALLAGLNACGPARKSVFPPMVSVQQLHVTDDGQWQMQLRIQNNSYDAVKFSALHLDMRMDGETAGIIDKSVDLDIPALSVDIATARLTPSAAAAKALSTHGNSVRYMLDGTATGQPEQDDKPRTFKVHGKDWLSPVPGIAATWR